MITVTPNLARLMTRNPVKRNVFVTANHLVRAAHDGPSWLYGTGKAATSSGYSTTEVTATNVLCQLALEPEFINIT